METLFNNIIERASAFADLKDEISKAMLKTAIVNSNINMKILLNLDDYHFMTDIVGLFGNFDFESNQLMNDFLPISANKK